MMRSTLYGHFVAGTDRQELQPIVERLHKHGVKLILDYSMESDIGKNQSYANTLPKDLFELLNAILFFYISNP